MEIKVGIQQTARELTLESKQTADEIEKAVLKAITEASVLLLKDENGRKVIIPAAKIAYLELGKENARKVGFGAAQ
ncbi:MAG: DUF3107 domain-containing protein [Propionibacteriaceae bacterium]|nr:DUF3107 domain-containing protein [Propionibacteriaceae bacterium]